MHVEKIEGLFCQAITFIFNLIGSEVFEIFKILFFQINTKRTNPPKNQFWVNFIQTKISNILKIFF
jgi:hypothetical protein